MASSVCMATRIAGGRGTMQLSICLTYKPNHRNQRFVSSVSVSTMQSGVFTVFLSSSA